MEQKLRQLWADSLKAIESLDYDLAGVEFVGGLHLRLREDARNRNEPVERVGVRRAVARNLAARLRPRRGLGRMRVDHAPDALEVLVGLDVRRRVGRRTQAALDDLSVEIDENHDVASPDSGSNPEALPHVRTTSPEATSL